MMLKPFSSSFLLILLLQLFISVMASSSAPSVEVESSDNMTALQKHVSFFDRNKDGIIYLSETYQGFRAIGCGVALSSFSAGFIHLGLSSKTRPGKPPSPLLPIEVANIALGKHGSDSGAYDTEGRFVPEKFEEIFQKHAHANPNSLTEQELSEMLEANAQPNDNAGKLAAKSEWNILYKLCKDKDGLLQKETVRAVYDGSLFYQMEKNKSFSAQAINCFRAIGCGVALSSFSAGFIHLGLSIKTARGSLHLLSFLSRLQTSP